MPDQSSNQSALRATSHNVRVFFTVFKAATVMESTVDSTPSFPALNLTHTITSGSDTDVNPGQRVDIEDASGNFKGRTRVRFAGTISSTNLPIRELSDTEIDVAATDIIKVYNEYPLSDLLVADTTDFSPDELAYTGQGENPKPISCSGGPWFGDLDDGASIATIQMTGDTSINVDPDSTPGNFAHLWTLPTGIAFASGSVSTDANPVLEAASQENGYIVEHRVTDSDNSVATTQYVPVVVKHAGNTYSCLVDSPPETDEDGGWRGTAQPFGSNLGLSDIPDGALVSLWVKETINGVQQSFGASSSGREHIAITGYLRRDDSDGSAETDELRFEIISPLARLGEILGLSKLMQEDTTPDHWHELKTLTTKRAIIQLASYYTNMLQTFDLIFHSSYESRPFTPFFLQKQSPLDQIRELTRATDARLVCMRSGRFEVQMHLDLLALTDRAGETTTLTIGDADVLGYSMAREQWNPVSQLKALGFDDSASPHPIFAKAPEVPTVANGEERVEKLIYDDNTQLYARCGLHYAKAARVYIDSDGLHRHAPSIDVTLRGSYMQVFDLNAEWVEFEAGATSNLREIELSDFRWLIRAISTQYDDEGSGTVVLTLDAETAALKGVDDTPKPDTTLPPTGDSPPPFDGDQSPTDKIKLNGTVNMAMFAEDNVLYRCGPDFAGSLAGFDLQGASGGPVWVASATGLGGTIKDAVVDPYSYQTASVDGWVATTTGIYSFSNLGGVVTFVLRHTFAETVTAVAIQSTIAVENFVVAVYYNGTASSPGTYAVSSTDGTSFAEVRLTQNRSTNAGVGKAPNLALSINTAGVAYAAAFATGGDPVTTALYKTSDSGSSWATTSAPAFASVDTLTGLLHFPWNDNGSDAIAYWGAKDTPGSGTPNIFQLWRTNADNTKTDISPNISGKYGARAFKSLSSSTADRQRITACLIIDNDNTRADVFVSKDAGTTWTRRAQNTEYVHCHVPDDPDICYFFGQNGAVAYTSDDSVTIDDRSGNISTAGTIVNIMGF